MAPGFATALTRCAQAAAQRTAWSARGVLIQFNWYGLVGWLLAGLGLAGVARASDFVVTLRPGDTVWHISQQFLKEPSLWRKLSEYNGVVNALAVAPGRQIKIPARWLKVEPASATVLAQSGQARLIRPDEAPRALQISDELKAGDRLQVDANASVQLGFADGSRLLAGPQSVVHFDRLSAYGRSGMVDTSVRLLRGVVESQVSKRQNPALRFDVQTPLSLTSVRGTHYRVAFDPQERVGRTEVIEGSVQFGNASAQLAVAGGQGSVIRGDQAPTAAKALLPAMATAQLAQRIEYLPPTLALSAVVGAVGYEVQLSRDAQFNRIEAERVFNKPLWRGGDLADGSYWLRIRAVDATGLRGADAVHGFELAARPVAPLLLAPRAGATLRASQASLSWTGSEQARAFRLVVRTTGAQPTVVFDQSVSGTRHELAGLAEGAYAWQVASLDATGRQGPPGELRYFHIRHEPVPPSVSAPEIADDTLALTWVALPGQPRYSWEIAHDADFTQRLAAGESEQPNLRLPRPAGGVYYLRIRVIDDPIDPPPFGPTQRIDIPPPAPPPPPPPSDWRWTVPLGLLLWLVLL